MIPGVVNTCRACRAFSRPADHSVATSRMPTQFNERVQHDVLYLIAEKPQTITLWVWWTARKLWPLLYPTIGTEMYPQEHQHSSGSSSSAAPAQVSGQGSGSTTAIDPKPLTKPIRNGQKRHSNKNHVLTSWTCAPGCVRQREFLTENIKRS